MFLMSTIKTIDMAVNGESYRISIDPSVDIEITMGGGIPSGQLDSRGKLNSYTDELNNAPTIKFTAVGFTKKEILAWQNIFEKNQKNDPSYYLDVQLISFINGEESTLKCKKGMITKSPFENSISQSDKAKIAFEMIFETIKID